ncbi:hypothetical protein TthAA37_03310 [Thermus thermophilus]|uniref:SCP domain-containing protein n=1 Tax=Thermus thermophilus TaxID=274 RepID=A0AAD1KSG7_THETH|nr:hypothetical protein [Thermus thermophilus]BBL81519.1 hypothetical protein TthAA220_03030 [Thermus thermophilus]BBL83822.1 hypothetical protein TthAA229_03030 [Thermus thermophilus]BCZ86126.1 hypothetical protein TthAA11_03080 [Thermus thermophilus]BCZ88519.1 hypothetical protein TthAA22_03240 [Thermus thermophilus]BCZ91142.1 hypothetical protein TthAA37_03310 [Thermus thermophilus]
MRLLLLPACAGQGADPVLEALNRIRAEGRACGPSAPPLAWDARLTAAARAHTEDRTWPPTASWDTGARTAPPSGSG